MVSLVFIATTVLATGVFAQDLTSLSTSTFTSIPSLTASADVSAQTTLDVFIGTVTTGYVGRVIGADACETTIAFSCTAGPFICSGMEKAGEQTITQGPFTYEGTLSVTVEDFELSLLQTCDLYGTAPVTRAVCEITAVATDGTVSASSAETVTVTEFSTAQIPITAGAENLPSGMPVCTQTPTTTTQVATTSASETASGAAPTGASVEKDEEEDSAAIAGYTLEIYKIIVPLGVVLVGGVLL